LQNQWLIFFIAADKDVIDYLKYNLLKCSKSLPMIQVIGSLKRLELLRPRIKKDKLWENVHALQNGLRSKGFNIGDTNTCVTRFILRKCSGSYGNGNDLRKLRFFLSIVIYPVIPKGMILLRVIQLLRIH
jgi:glycine C-acetyltransferase